MSAPAPSSNPPPPAPARRPWPLKWILFAILIYAFLQMVYFFFSTRGN